MSRSRPRALIAGAIVAVAMLASACMTPEEQGVFDLTNQARNHLGKAPFGAEGALVSRAQQWSQHMAAQGRLSHNPNMWASVPGHCTGVAENIGYGPSPRSLYDGWMASPGHYNNIMGNYNWSGVGMFQASNGTWWGTQVFALC